MAWRLARSLDQLRKQVNADWPRRSKSSDGSIGDEKHASRSSDHNPWVKDGGTGVVTAIDITHDPRGGFDSYAFADMLLRNRDPRIKYVISNRRIGSGADGPNPWKWRKYSGSNPHDHHCHISVKANKSLYDSVDDWDLSGAASAPVALLSDHGDDQSGEVISDDCTDCDSAPQSTFLKLIKSKIAWASSALGCLSVTSFLGFLTDWRVVGILVAGALVAYIIYERSRKP